MSEFVGWPEIGQYRNAVKAIQNRVSWNGTDAEGKPVFDRTRKMPVLKFIGTVKIHGTNGGVIKNLETGVIICQSRSREISVESDNAGFAFFCKTRDNSFEKLFSYIESNTRSDKKIKKIAIFGEFFGNGIQKGVAVSELSKKFAIFSIRLIGEDFNIEW
jgi:hypothetical protein